MKFQIQRIFISLQLSFCLALTLTIGGDLNNNHNNSITYQFGAPQSTSSTLRPIVERIFSRTKRFLKLPPGGSIKFTAYVGKRILSPYPRGFSFVIEIATYYEGYPTTSETLPRWFRHPTKHTTPKPMAPTTPIYVYIPGIGLRYKARPAIKPANVHRIDYDDTALQWVDHPTKIEYADPKNWHQYTKYNNKDYQQDYYDQIPVAKKTQQWWPPMIEDGTYQQPLDFYDTEDYAPPSRHHFYGHRDRRQLFDKFEGFSKILKFDMKACILRAICECKSLLLPPGYSMLQDMMRLILTMPVHHSTTDEYTQAMSDNPETCEHQYHQKCPISFLNWIMNPIKPIKRFQ